MATFVFRPQASTGAKELARALNGRRLRALEGGRVFRRNPNTGANIAVNLTPQDKVVCWGASLPSVITDRVGVLNGGTLRNKYEDAVALAAAGIPTIQVALTRPVARAAVAAVAAQAGDDPAVALFERVRQLADEFTNVRFARGQVILAGITELRDSLGNLSTALQRPAPTPRPAVAAQAAVPAGDWLPRSNNHVGGNDLLQPPTTPNFWVKKEDITDEFRIHSFLGRSIRAGRKQPRVDQGHPPAHAWIRSWDGGWRIVYDGVTARQAQRELAHRAVAALGLQFGAVDIGLTRDGRLIVLEVNRAPGIEGGTIDRYVAAINRWVTTGR